MSITAHRLPLPISNLFVHFAAVVLISLALVLTLPAAPAHGQLANNITDADEAGDADKGECDKLGLEICPQSPTPQVVRGFIVNGLSYLITFIGLVALAALIWGGVSYITALGNDDKVAKAKMIIMYAIIGLIIVGFAAVIVNVIFAFFNPPAAPGG